MSAVQVLSTLVRLDPGKGQETNMKRHNTDRYYVVGEGFLCRDDKGAPATVRASSTEELTSFRFSRMGQKGIDLGQTLRESLATGMTAPVEAPDDPAVPAGFTYLGQFLDHDLTMDATTNITLGQPITVEQLIQGRSPSLDLDSLYGFGPTVNPQFYSDGARLKIGTAASSFPAPVANFDRPGFDLPRVGVGATRQDERVALIPDHRNDENLAVAQTHVAFIRFHNKVVDQLADAGTPTDELFEKARDVVVRHYQWMIRHDYLGQIIDPDVVEDVFTNGRRYFETPAPFEADPATLNSYMCARPDDAATIPIEFTVAAFRLGHSQVREAYQWNRIFRTGGVTNTAGTLDLLFRFSATSGNLGPPGTDVNDPNLGNAALPTNWIADFRRLFDFTRSDRPDLVAPDGAGGVERNVIKRLDTLLVDPLRNLPIGSFGGRSTVPVPSGVELNLAFRNLTRAQMVELATGPQMADHFGIPRLTDAQIGEAAGMSALSDADRTAVAANPPLWFYILREAELNGGKLAGVGARIVAETFHRAMETSRTSIVRDPGWTPTLGPVPGRFLMTDLLLVAYDGQADQLNPMGD